MCLMPTCHWSAWCVVINKGIACLTTGYYTELLDGHIPYNGTVTAGMYEAEQNLLNRFIFYYADLCYIYLLYGHISWIEFSAVMQPLLRLVRIQSVWLPLLYD